jgi:hypothetical protein
MYRGIDQSAPCWNKAFPDDHDLVYLGQGDISLPGSVLSIDGSPVHPDDARRLYGVTIGPFEVAFHRCVRCGMGYCDTSQRADSRLPTEEERERLIALETVKLRTP